MKKILSSKKKKLSLFAASLLSLLLVVCVTLSSSASAAPALIKVNISSYGLITKLADLMNRDRTSGDGYWVDSNGAQHKVGKLSAIPWDSNLEKVAMFRVAEIMLYYSNVRPDGTSFTYCNFNGVHSDQEYIYKIENASYFDSNKTPGEIYNVLFNVGRGPAAQSMMATNFKSFSAACAWSGNTLYVVLEFSLHSGDGRRGMLNDSPSVIYDTSLVPERYVTSADNSSVTVDMQESKTLMFGSMEHYIGQYLQSTLKESTDFKVTWTSSNPSKLKVDGNRITGIWAGDYTVTGVATVNGTKVATRNINVHVNGISVFKSGCLSVSLPQTTYTYTGAPITPEPVITYGSTVLKKGVDYTIRYSYNEDAGKGVVWIKGDGKNFIGEFGKEFIIVPADISKATITIPSVTYNGNWQRPTPVVTLNGNKIVSGYTTYSVEYTNNVSAGTGKAIFTGKGNFTGTVEKTFTINKADLSTATIVGQDTKTYNGSEYVPSFDLYLPNQKIYISDSDYTVSISGDNVNVGTFTVIYTGKNNCKGTCKKVVTINPFDLSKSYPFSVNTQVYTGSPIIPNIRNVEFIRQVDAFKDVDYTITATNNTDAGIAEIVFTGKGNYKGTYKTTFVIDKASIRNATVTGITSKLYMGKPVVLDDIKLTFYGKTLVLNKDYKLEYLNNNKVGQATVMITGLGNFKDSVTESFTIYESKLPEFNPNASGTGVEGFVERLYTVALGRASEPAGKAYWVEKLMTKQMTGGAAAKKMLLSQEFIGIKYSNEEFVEVLYRTFFNRSGEPTGTKYWLDKLASGMTRENVIASFIDSNEWAGICSSYGISSGNSKNPPEVAPTDKTVAFVKRLYTCCLGRNGEIKGIADWSIALANKKYTGKEVAQKFFFSTEFKNKNLDNTEFVKRLYRTLMGREAGSSEITYWTNLLTSGKTREQIFDMFANSKEWATICSNAGIASGAKAQALTLDIDLLEEETENQIPESEDDIVTEITETEADEATEEVISEDVSETADEEITDTTDEEETEVSDIPSEVETVEEVSADETVAEESDASDYTETAVSENIEETDCLEVA